MQHLLSMSTKGNSVDQSIAVTRVFNYWEEEWEAEAVFKRSPISEAKLLEKYGGFSMCKIDSGGVVYSDPDDLRWYRVTTRKGGVKSGGYALITYYDEHYNKEASEEDKEDHIELWEFCVDLRFQIATYYNQHKEFGVKVMEVDVTDEGNSNNNVDENEP